MRKHLTNSAVTMVCIALFLIYAIFLTAYIPPGTLRVAVTVALLVVLGALSAPSMSGSLAAKILFLIAVPVVHIIYEGIDPAKPSLNIVVGLVEFVCISIGATAGHIANRKLRPSVH